MMNNEMQDQLYDIYDLWYQPWYQDTWNISLAIIAACFFVMIAWFVYKTWFKRVKVVTLEDRVFGLLSLADEIILKSPLSLNAAYLSLSAAIKLYISEVYKVHVDHLTDVEIQNVLVKLLGEKYGEKMQEVFKHAAQVKFQQQNLSGLDGRDAAEAFYSDMEFVRQFIRETINNQGIGE